MAHETHFEPAAGGGLLDRRLFLKRGLVFSVATGLMGKPFETVADDGRLPWMKQPGEPFSNYGRPSNHERRTIRWTMSNRMAPGNGVSWSPLHDLEGIITPSGLHFERHHNGVPQIEPQQHRLLIHGLVHRPLVFSVTDLLRYPMQSRYCFIECGGNSNAGWRSEPIQTQVGYFHGMVSCSEWTGIPLHILLAEAGVKDQGQWIIAEGADASVMNVSIPLKKALDDCIVALFQNGERITPRCAGLGRRTQCQMAPAFACGKAADHGSERNRQIYGTVAVRQSPPIYLRHGDQIVDHQPFVRKSAGTTRPLSNQRPGLERPGPDQRRRSLGGRWSDLGQGRVAGTSLGAMFYPVPDTVAVGRRNRNP